MLFSTHWYMILYPETTKWMKKEKRKEIKTYERVKQIFRCMKFYKSENKSINLACKFRILALILRPKQNGSQNESPETSQDSAFESTQVCDLWLHSAEIFGKKKKKKIYKSKVKCMHVE